MKFDLFAGDARRRKIESLGDPLQIIARHIDFAQLAGLIDALFPRPDAAKGARPPYPTEVMVRVLIFKRLYNLSDEQVEYQLLDRMSLQRFCQLSDSANVPDRNTIWQFAQRIGADGGHLPGRGQPTAAPRLHRPRWAGHRCHLGISAHPALHQELDEDNTSKDVYADRGYWSQQRSQMLQALGYREHIQRKAQPGKPLSECQKGRKRRIATIRVRVEHSFAQIAQMGGKLIRTIGQARATAAMTLMAACYNLKRLAMFIKTGVDAFYKTRPSKSEVRPQMVGG